MLWEVGTCVTYFDELRYRDQRERSLWMLDRILTPVPLSTTNGRSESMVELKKTLFVMLCLSQSQHSTCTFFFLTILHPLDYMDDNEGLINFY